MKPAGTSGAFEKLHRLKGTHVDWKEPTDSEVGGAWEARVRGPSWP